MCLVVSGPIFRIWRRSLTTFTMKPTVPRDWMRMEVSIPFPAMKPKRATCRGVLECNSAERVKLYIKKTKQKTVQWIWCRQIINMVPTALLHVWETFCQEMSFFVQVLQVAPAMFYTFPTCHGEKNTHIKTLHFLCESVGPDPWQPTAETLCHCYKNILSYCHHLVVCLSKKYKL